MNTHPSLFILNYQSIFRIIPAWKWRIVQFFFMPFAKLTTAMAVFTCLFLNVAHPDAIAATAIFWKCLIGTLVALLFVSHAACRLLWWRTARESIRPMPMQRTYTGDLVRFAAMDIAFFMIRCLILAGMAAAALAAIFAASFRHAVFFALLLVADISIHALYEWIAAFCVSQDVPFSRAVHNALAAFFRAPIRIFAYLLLYPAVCGALLFALILSLYAEVWPGAYFIIFAGFFLCAMSKPALWINLALSVSEQQSSGAEPSENEAMAPRI